jgi:hypothetical protein
MPFFGDRKRLRRIADPASYNLRDMGCAGSAAQSPPLTKELKVHAFTSSRNGFSRSGCIALAGQSLHTDAGNNQVNLECGGGDLRGFVATEHFRTVSFVLPDPHRDLIVLAECKPEGANDSWNNISGDFDPRAGGCAPAMAA